MYEVADDLNDALLIEAAKRFPSNLTDKDRFACGFRLGAGVYVAELIREGLTDKLRYVEVEFTLNVYALHPKDTEKVTLTPKLPHEKRPPRIMLPSKELMATRTLKHRFEKEEDND